MPSRRNRTEAEDQAALAREAQRLGLDPEAAESAAQSAVAASATPAASPESTASEPVAPEPPPWTPNKERIPDWIIRASRGAWKVEKVETPSSEPRAKWTGGDIEYTYFKGGFIVARFREGGLYGALKTDPVPEFEKDPEPPAETPQG